MYVKECYINEINHIITVIVSTKSNAYTITQVITPKSDNNANNINTVLGKIQIYDNNS